MFDDDNQIRTGSGAERLQDRPRRPSGDDGALQEAVFPRALAAHPLGGRQPGEGHRGRLLRHPRQPGILRGPDPEPLVLQGLRRGFDPPQGGHLAAGGCRPAGASPRVGCGRPHLRPPGRALAGRWDQGGRDLPIRACQGHRAHPPRRAPCLHRLPAGRGPLREGLGLGQGAGRRRAGLAEGPRLGRSGGGRRSRGHPGRAAGAAGSRCPRPAPVPRRHGDGPPRVRPRRRLQPRGAPRGARRSGRGRGGLPLVHPKWPQGVRRLGGVRARRPAREAGGPRRRPGSVHDGVGHPASRDLSVGRGQTRRLPRRPG